MRSGVWSWGRLERWGLDAKARPSDASACGRGGSGVRVRTRARAGESSCWRLGATRCTDRPSRSCGTAARARRACGVAPQEGASGRRAGRRRRWEEEEESCAERSAALGVRRGGVAALGQQIVRTKAESQRIVATRPLCRVQYPVPYSSRLQVIHRMGSGNCDRSRLMQYGCAWLPPHGRPLSFRHGF